MMCEPLHTSLTIYAARGPNQIEGQNVAIEYRWAEGRYDRLPDLVADLVHSRVDVIATSGGDTVAAAAKGATLTMQTGRAMRC
jgi:hypothetical protein